jgi:hypothetical protein
MSTQTTGLSVDAVLTLDTDAANHTLTLSLSGVNSHQLLPVLKDLNGSTQSAAQAVTYCTRTPYVCSVSAGGLITGINRGTGIVEAAYPAFNGSFPIGSDGLPTSKIFNEIIVTVKV